MIDWTSLAINRSIYNGSSPIGNPDFMYVYLQCSAQQPMPMPMLTSDKHPGSSSRRATTSFQPFLTSRIKLFCAVNVTVSNDREEGFVVPQLQANVTMSHYLVRVNFFIVSPDLWASGGLD